MICFDARFNLHPRDKDGLNLGTSCWWGVSTRGIRFLNFSATLAPHRVNVISNMMKWAVSKVFVEARGVAYFDS